MWPRTYAEKIRARTTLSSSPSLSPSSIASSMTASDRANSPVP